MLIDQYATKEKVRYHGFVLDPDDEQDRVIAAWLGHEPYPTRVIKQLLLDALEGRIVLKELPDNE